MHWLRLIFHSETLASDHYASDDRTDGDDHYDTFPDHCKTWTSEYGAWICTSNDRESV